MKFADTVYAEGLSKEDIKFIELMCSKSSELIREQDFSQRLNKACLQAKVPQTILNEPRIKQGIFRYISYFDNFNKGQLLFAYQKNLWHIQQALMEDLTVEAGQNITEEDLTKRDKMLKLAKSWEETIQALYRELFGYQEFKDIAAEEVKMVLSPEERLRKRKQA